MHERDTVWFWLAGKERPGVVLEAQPDLVRVAYGTSEFHDWPRVEVHTRTRQGRAFPLREVTYFYGANTAWQLRRDLQRGQAQCTWELLFEIRKLVEDYDASVGEP